MRAVAELIPLLRAHEHLAGRALLVDALGEGSALGLCDAVIVGEGGFADLGTKRKPLGFEGGDFGFVALDDFGGAKALALEHGFAVGDGLSGGSAVALEGLGALQAFELGVFEAGEDLALREGRSRARRR